MKKIRYIAFILFLCMLIYPLLGCAKNDTDRYLEENIGDNSQSRSVEQDALIELFYFSPCESCDEDIKFENAIRDSIDVNSKTNLSFRKYNAFRDEDKTFMEARMSELGLTIGLEDLPVALVNGELFAGQYHEIASKVKDRMSDDSGFIQDLPSLKEDTNESDSLLVFFTTYSCGSCEEVKNYLETINSHFIDVELNGTSFSSKIKVLEKNILEDNNLDLLNGLMKLYNVENQDQQVPILFYENGYLSGVDNIKKNTEEVVKRGEALGFEYGKFEGAEEGYYLSNNQEYRSLDLAKVMQILITGFLNGLNPCSASMLFMVLSIILMTNYSYLRGSLLFMAGKIITYIVMGLGVFWLFFALQDSYLEKVDRVLTFTFATLALIFCIMNMFDYIQTKRKEYGKVVSQLPSRLRQWNHNIIEKLKSIPAALFLPALFLIGVVISVGEFFCTGQLYVASIYNLSRQEGGVSLIVAIQLIIYVLAMSIPQLILITIIGKTKNTLFASRLALDGMPVVKLIYAGVFLYLFVSILLL